MVNLSWKRRLAILLSVLWVLVVGAMSTLTGGLGVGLVLTIAPLIFVWGIWWVVSALPKRTVVVSEVGARTERGPPVAQDGEGTWPLLLWIGIIGCFAIPIGVRSYIDSGSGDAGRSFGQMLVTLLIVGAIAAAISRGKSASRKLAARLLVFTVMLGAGVFQANKIVDAAEERRAVANSLTTIATSFERNAESWRDVVGGQPKGTPERVNKGTEKPVDSKARMTRMMGEMARLIDTASKEYRDGQLRQSKAMDALGFETLLLPQTLASPSGRARARDALRKYNVLLSESMALERAQKATAESWINVNAAQMSPDEASSLLDGFRRGASKSEALSRTFYQVQRDFIDVFERILDTIENAPGGVQYGNQQVLFSDPASLAKFNQLVQQVNALADREAKAQQAILESHDLRARQARDLAANLSK
jgi:hypothetical protein